MYQIIKHKIGSCRWEDNNTLFEDGLLAQEHAQELSNRYPNEEYYVWALGLDTDYLICQYKNGTAYV